MTETCRPPPDRPAYLRDPAAIYRRSFALIAEETDLSRLPPPLVPVVVRLIHACGMPDIVPDLAFGGAVVEAGRAALRRGAPVLADCRMVASGIIAARMPADNPVLCRLGDPAVPARAATLGTTRSAAAVDLWRPVLDGAVVAIGNAPTALFHLLEMLDRGGPQPAVILAFPVGFVGAAESKQTLVDAPCGVPFLTLRGRRGGSALAAAAVNALAAMAAQSPAASAADLPTERALP